MAVLLGFDIGGTKLGIGLGTDKGELLGTSRRDNRNTDPNEVLPWMVSESRRLVAAAGLQMSDVAAFGISAPFPADAARGIMTKPTNNPLWRNVPILDYLKEHLAIPGCFENDANCGALAEWFFGAGRGCTDFIYLTLSTGIGGGIISAGKLVRGGAALSAGELGHICIQLGGRKCSCGIEGCYEAYCGGVAIANRMREELSAHPDSMLHELCGGDLNKLDMILLEKAFRAGDEYAMKLWDEMSLRHAQAFGLFIQSFNPQKLVLGTLAWAIGDIYIDPIKAQLSKFCWKEPMEACEIVCSELRRDIASYAGIAAALNYLNERAL
ncbi:MAG: ROK family protein [Lentisphaerae bacterium]|nr:ROK family protein [Lentisphaerota bacterium]MBQ9804024.1 ROK family protein [Lentisphaeria bacterium]